MSDRSTAVRDWLKGSAYGDRAAIARSAGVLPLTALRVANGKTSASDMTIKRFELAAEIRQKAIIRELWLIQNFLEK